MPLGARLRLAGGGVRGWISGSARASRRSPGSRKADPGTPPPGMRRMKLLLPCSYRSATTMCAAAQCIPSQVRSPSRAWERGAERHKGTVQRSRSRAAGKESIHIVSAWARKTVWSWARSKSTTRVTRLPKIPDGVELLMRKPCREMRVSPRRNRPKKVFPNVSQVSAIRG
jgi:hypothetical protein